MALSHAYTTLLSTLHERSSLLSTPSATVPPSLHRTLKRQIDSFAKAVEQQQRGASEQDAKDVRAKWDRIKEALERDEDGRKVLVAATDSHPILTTLSEPPPPPPSASQQHTQHLDDEPYRDDVDPLAPNPPEQNNASLLQAQRRIFDDQETQLDALSLSIGRQHELGLRMNEELELQGELLEDLDGDVERTGLRLGRASGQLQRVSRKVKDHGSLCALFGLIVLLMALIILFK